MAAQARQVDKIKALIALLAFGLSSALAQATQDLHYLNQLRKQTGLTPFIHHSLLAQAAKNHANYLSLNKTQGHFEQPFHSLFTGKQATDRALFVGYPNRQVSENVTSKMGDPTHYKPIDQLMSAIYHRFAFLTTTKNEIGLGQQLGTMNAYVYVMGNSSISALCERPSFNGNGRYVFKICADSQHKIEETHLKQTLLKQQLKQPLSIKWPAANSQHIPTVFYEESPDPLPHASVSGYPISIEFNSAFFKQPPSVTQFTISNLKTGNTITNTLYLNKKNDPNHLLSDYQHVLFPLKRLDWNTTYQISLNYNSGPKNQVHSMKWQFTTEKPSQPIITFKPSIKDYLIPINKSVLFYFPPKNQNDAETSMSYRDFGMGLNVSYYDKNTLIIKAENSGKADIIFHHEHITIRH